MIKWWMRYDDMVQNYGSLCDASGGRVKPWRGVITFDDYDYIMVKGDITLSMRTPNDYQVKPKHNKVRRPQQVTSGVVHGASTSDADLLLDNEDVQDNTVNEDGHQPDGLLLTGNNPLSLDFIKVVTT